jgi:hypothetical protein
VDLSPRKIYGSSGYVEEYFGLKRLGVYINTSECCQVYVPQTGSSIDIRLKEYSPHI